MSSVSTRATARHRLLLRSPADILEMVPFMLGFHPVDSLVLIALEAAGVRTDRVGVVGRMDRLSGGDLGLPDALDQLFAAARRSAFSRAVAVWYGRPPALGELRHLEWAAQRAGFELVDVLAVEDGRWRSLLCTDDYCCPPGGTSLDAGTSALVAQATFEGFVARPTRDSVAAILAPDTDRERLTSVLQAQSACPSSRADRVAVRRLFAASRRLGVLSDTELCDFGVALRRTDVRDACWLGIDDRRITGDGLWQELARRLPSPFDVAPLFLFGWLSWRTGNGTLATMAAERALEADPDYSAAAMLLTAVQHGLDPFRTPRLRSRRPR